MSFRSALTFALAVVALAAPSAALAQGFGDLKIAFQKRLADGSFREFSETEFAEFWNRANCLCQTPVGIELRLENAPSSLGAGIDVELWAGVDCDDLENRSERDARCELLATLPDLRELRTEQVIPVTADQIMWPKTECGEDEITRKVFAIVNEDGDTSPDQVWTSKDIPVDTEPPPAPADVSSQGGEDAAIITFDLPKENAADVRSFQALCASTKTGKPIRSNPPAPEFVTPEGLCDYMGGGSGGGGGQDAGVGDDGGMGADFDELDPRFVCTGEVSLPADTIRIDTSGIELDLAGGEKIALRLVVIDDHRNARIVDAGETQPRPVKDFWELYGDSGGRAQGGLCGVAVGQGTGYGALGALFGALTTLAIPLWVWLARPRRERRRRRDRDRRGGQRCGRRGGRRGTAILVLAAAWAAPRVAAAQVFLDEATADDDPSPPAWVFELKFGPYTPDVDDEPGLRGAPFLRTFGGEDRLMALGELDRFFLWPLGQLGVGVSVGWTQASAKAFLQDENGNATDMRSEADDTTFKLLPAALSVVYRFTRLADETFLPLVPYGKLGLAYYLWWVTKGDGDTAETMTNGKAFGATLGWQGTVGLSLRADRFDPEAARSLESELGIRHAGFFVELLYADVSGFGAADRLRVGDTTWFAGVNFEF